MFLWFENRMVRYLVGKSHYCIDRESMVQDKLAMHLCFYVVQKQNRALNLKFILISSSPDHPDYHTNILTGFSK